MRAHGKDEAAALDVLLECNACFVNHGPDERFLRSAAQLPKGRKEPRGCQERAAHEDLNRGKMSGLAHSTYCHLLEARALEQRSQGRCAGKAEGFRSGTEAKMALLELDQDSISRALLQWRSASRKCPRFR
jgi:hypothetical protein